MRGVNFWVSILFFIAGCLVCFYATQYVFLDIDYKVNVVETLIDIATLIVGLYLGITINSNFNRKQHFINFIEPKLEKVLLAGSNLRVLVENNSSIDSNTINASIKNINLEVAQLSKIFKAFQKEIRCIDEIDVAIDNFESTLNIAPINNNVIDYTASKASLIRLLDIIDLKTVTAINVLHTR